MTDQTELLNGGVDLADVAERGFVDRGYAHPGVVVTDVGESRDVIGRQHRQRPGQAGVSVDAAQFPAVQVVDVAGAAVQAGARQTEAATRVALEVHIRAQIAVAMIGEPSDLAGPAIQGIQVDVGVRVVGLGDRTVAVAQEDDGLVVGGQRAACEVEELIIGAARRETSRLTDRHEHHS